MALAAPAETLVGPTHMLAHDIFGVAIETNDDRAHARDECLQVDSLHRGVTFYYPTTVC